jgi:myosin-7
MLNICFLFCQQEPSILFCLETRFKKDAIYTLTGPILIAVNPFKTLDIYGDAVLQGYHKKTSNVTPHLYQSADIAYNNMLTMIANNKKADQCILISGESGAGKTESTKILLKFLTSVSSSKDASVMDRVMKVRPVVVSNRLDY